MKKYYIINDDDDDIMDKEFLFLVKYLFFLYLISIYDFIKWRKYFDILLYFWINLRIINVYKI